MTGAAIDGAFVQERSVGDHTINTLPALRSSQAKLVYLALVVGSGATVGELRASLRLPALSLYPILELLIERDLVEREGATYLPVNEDSTTGL